METPYYNCVLSFVDVKSNEQGYLECVVIFNSGWLSCKRPFTFLRSDAEKFVRRIRKIKTPFGIVATLEDINKNMRIQMECTAPGTIMISGECFENSEFEQQAKLGFNLERAKLNDFTNQMSALLIENG